MLRAEDRRTRRTAAPATTALGLALLLVTAPLAPVEAQQGASGQDDGARAGQAADTLVQAAEVEYRRETFSYPQRTRNPFEPVNAGVQEGPRFQNLVLAGVIYSPSVGSVAVLVDRSTGRRYRVREGERIGQATVLNIRRSDVLFSVSGATQSRQETLQVEKQNEEVQR